MPDEMLMADIQQQQQHQQMLQAQLDNAAAVMMSNGTGTLVRPPIGGVPIFPPGVSVYLDLIMKTISASFCFLIIKIHDLLLFGL